MKKRNQKGFTIMEMLIVVAIIAILVAIAIPTFNNALTKSKEAADIANIRAAYAEEMVTALTEEGNAKTPNEFKTAIEPSLNFKDRLEITNGSSTIVYKATKVKTEAVPDGIFKWELTKKATNQGGAGGGN